MTTTIPNNRRDEHDKALYKRYNVTKNHPTQDGPDDPHAIYFVLRLDHFGDDPAHIEACQLAAMEFIRHTENRKMAEQLRRIVAEQAGLLTAKIVAQSLAEV